MSGELPSDQTERLGSPSYTEKIIQSLKKEKLIRTYYKDRLRAYRLSTKAKQILLTDEPMRFSFYLTGSSETNQPKSEITRRLRLHRIAETLMTMHNAGVTIFRDEKPNVFFPDGTPFPSRLRIDEPAFYTSREMRECGLEFVKIRGARMVGVLLTPHKAFLVYNTADAMMKWEYKSEMRAKALVKTLLCRQRLPEQYGTTDIQALLLGSSMDMAYQILTEPQGGGRNYFILDGNYEHFHYIPSDYAGETALKILCDPQKDAKLRQVLSESLYPAQPGNVIENDAFTPNGDPVLFTYDFDLPRIMRFENALRLQNKHGHIICFDFQADTLKRFCSNRIDFQTINLQKYIRRFEH